MILKKFLFILLLVFNVSHVFAAGMSQQQILNILDRVARHNLNTARAIASSDTYTACLEYREALRLFNQIDSNDIPRVDQGEFNRFRQQMIDRVNLMKQIC